MKRKNDVPRSIKSLTSILSFTLSVLFITSLFILTSCSNSGKKYNFQPKSMYWMQFRGPNSSGIAPVDANPPIHFNADTNLLWKTEILPGWSSPCIVDDKIFLTGFNKEDNLLYVFAVNRKDGEIIWMDSIMPLGYYNLHPVNTYANPTVATNSKNIFAHFPNYGLIAYDLNGIKQWEYTHDVMEHDQSCGASPVVQDSILIAQIESEGKASVTAFSSQTGDTIWQQPSALSNATPLIWNSMVIVHRSNYIIALDLASGQYVWWVDTPTKGVATPVIHDDMLYVNTWTNFGSQKARSKQPSFEELIGDYDKNENMKLEKDELPEDLLIFERPGSSDLQDVSMNAKDDELWSMFDENKDEAFNEAEWKGMWEFAYSAFGIHGMLALPLNGLDERPTTDIIWKVNEDSPEVPSPLIVNDNVLFITNGGKITVINRENGEVFFKGSVGAPGSYMSSPMLAGNKIYTCSYGGTVTVLSADDFSVLGHNKLKEKIAASPVAIDDVLYVRTAKHMYAFREK